MKLKAPTYKLQEVCEYLGKEANNNSNFTSDPISSSKTALENYINHDYKTWKQLKVEIKSFNPNLITTPETTIMTFFTSFNILLTLFNLEFSAESKLLGFSNTISSLFTCIIACILLLFIWVFLNSTQRHYKIVQNQKNWIPYISSVINEVKPKHKHNNLENNTQL